MELLLHSHCRNYHISDYKLCNRSEESTQPGFNCLMDPLVTIAPQQILKHLQYN